MLSKDNFTRIKQYREMGMRASIIGKKLGVSEVTIRKWWNLTEDEYDYAKKISGRVSEYKNYILTLLP